MAESEWAINKKQKHKKKLRVKTLPLGFGERKFLSSFLKLERHKEEWQKQRNGRNRPGIGMKKRPN